MNLNQRGFIPLSTSMLSSEPDFDIERRPFDHIKTNVASPINKILPRSRQESKFSFDNLPVKRSCTKDCTLQQKGYEKQLEKLLFQPVAAKQPESLVSYKELEDLLGQENFLPSYNNDTSSLASDNAPSIINTLNPSNLDNLEEIWLSNSEFLSTQDLEADPLFGLVNDAKSFERSRDNAQPSPRITKKLLSVHELANAPKDTPKSLHVKVIPKQRPNPITPNFSKRIVTKALESKDRSREERRYYNQFVRKLCADEILNESDEDEDDDVYDLLALSGESDDGTNEIFIDNPRPIPNKEILELFAEAESVADDDLDFDNVPPVDTPALIDEEFVKTLNRQLNLHFQLLVQSLALSGEIKGADQIWVTALKLMIRLDDFITTFGSNSKVYFLGSQGLELLLRILRQSPLHEALLVEIRKSINDPDLRLRALVQSIPFKLKFKQGKTTTFSKSFWHILSLFGNPFDSDYSIIPKNSDSELLDHNQIVQETTGLYGRRVDSFLAVEDRLLLLGLYRYGFGNWEKIQSYLLPTRSAKQLATRYKNLTTRHAPPNPIKEFLSEAITPLSKVEEQLLTQGVRTYKDDWISISIRFLPHRPAAVLKRLWLRYRAPKSTFLDLELPTEDEQDSDYQEDF